MTPKKLPTNSGDSTDARQSLRIGRQYYEVAQLIADEDGAAINVCVRSHPTT